MSATHSRFALAKRWRSPVVVLLMLMVPVAVDQIWVHIWRIVPVGYATTRLLGPASKAGGINYVRGLNQLARKGVTKKNDAAVLLIRAAGPELFPAQTWYGKNILWQLDMKPFTPNASRPITLSQWAQKHPLPKNPNRDNRWHLELNLASHAWTATQYPVMAQWIQANLRPLALLARAVKRPRYYIPLESPDRGLIHARVPMLRPLNFLAQVAAMRGMLLLGQGNAAGAIAWANRIQQLALLVTQSPDVASYLVGIRFESISLRMVQAAANSGQFSAKQLGALLASVETRPSLPPLAEALDDQRYTGLSMIMMLDQNGLMILNMKGMPKTDKEVWNALWPIDYTAMMQEENQIFDAEVAASKLPDFIKECRQMKHLKQIINGYASPANVILDPANIAIVLANPSAVHLACYRRSITTQRRLTEIAIALARFKTVRGKYPAILADLVPTDLKSAPTDAFSGAPFQYAVTADGRGFQVKSMGLPTGIGGLDLRRGVAANIFVRGGNWGQATK